MCTHTYIHTYYLDDFPSLAFLDFLLNRLESVMLFRASLVALLWRVG